MTTAKQLGESVKTNFLQLGNHTTSEEDTISVTVDDSIKDVATTTFVNKYGLGTGVGTGRTVLSMFNEDSLNSVNLTGTYSFTADTTDTPTSLASFVIHNERTYPAGQSATQIVPGKNNRLYYRQATGGGTDSARTWGNWLDVVCVSKWTSGTSWYRVYSDGWIEQGGNFAGDGANVTQVTLHKPFSNTNYSVFTTPEYTTTSTSNLAVSKNTSYPKTTTGFYIYNSTTTTFGHYWEAKGY